jgi:3-hydroxyacyl-[acyl-carrier-protein] dehydratase
VTAQLTRPLLSHADITRVLPHRHPVLLVDSVLELEPGVAITATKAVTGSEPCYAGLADGLPDSAYAYPVSLIVESFGQAGAVLWLVGTPDTERPVGTLIFGAARRVVVHDRAYPGDVLTHRVRIETITGPNAFMSGEVHAGDRLIATIGQVLAVIRETDALDGS